MADYRDDHRKTDLVRRETTDLSPTPDFSWVDPSWSARRRSRSIGKTLEGYVGGLEIAKRFFDAAAECQRSVREFEHARAQRALTPVQLEIERQGLVRELRRSQQAINVAAEEYEVDMLLRHEQKIQVLQRIKKLREGGISSGPMDDTPPDLRGPLATEHLVSRNREWIRRKIEEIRQRAAAEGRPLSIEEIEQIDRYQDAEVSSEASIRRRSASDL